MMVFGVHRVFHEKIWITLRCSHAGWPMVLSPMLENSSSPIPLAFRAEAFLIFFHRPIAATFMEWLSLAYFVRFALGERKKMRRGLRTSNDLSIISLLSLCKVWNASGEQIYLFNNFAFKMTIKTNSRIRSVVTAEVLPSRARLSRTRKYSAVPRGSVYRDPEVKNTSPFWSPKMLGKIVGKRDNRNYQWESYNPWNYGSKTDHSADF